MVSSDPRGLIFNPINAVPKEIHRPPGRPTTETKRKQKQHIELQNTGLLKTLGWVANDDRHIVCVTQRSSPQSNHIPFPLCLWSNEQTNHVWETWLHVNRRTLESEHASQFSTNQSIVAGSVSASSKKVNFVKVCFKRLWNFQVKKEKVWWAYKALTGSVVSF